VIAGRLIQKPAALLGGFFSIYDRTTFSVMTSPEDGSREFQEIAHCGGQVTFRVHTDENGRRTIQFGIRHSRPTAAAWFAVYSLRQGVPVGMIEMRGIGQPWNPATVPGCIPVFIASDSEARFGHRCGYCRGYWRSNGVPACWPITCPYCGDRGSTRHFLTPGQVRCLEEYCRQAEVAYASLDGEYILDMDEVADVAGTDAPKPRFYYAEERQQNRFACTACGAFNDILGRYGYCSTCGSHNGISELEKDLQRIEERIAAGTDLEALLFIAFEVLVRRLLAITERREAALARQVQQIREEAKAAASAFVSKHIPDFSMSESAEDDFNDYFNEMIFGQKEPPNTLQGVVDDPAWEQLWMDSVTALKPPSVGH
jgi:hypothetical protein